MGTTAEKLTYLNDTKGLLKDSINSLGGEITSQTTFRQYATELDSIYSRLPKVSGTGSNISLSPTLKGRLGSVLKGNTLQDGTPTPDTPVEIQSATGLQKVSVEGKNLYNINNFSVSSWDTGGNYTSKVNDTLKTISDWTIYRSKCVEIPNLKKNTDYVLSGNLKSTNTNGGKVVIYGYNGSTTTSITNTATLSTGNFSLSFNTGNYTNIGVSFNGVGGSTSKETIFENIQIEKGSTATTYEPYQSQEYEINLGKNLLPNTATSQTINGITYTINEDKTITANGTATAHSVLNIYNTSLILQPGTYMFSGCPKNGSWGTYSMGYGTKNDSGNGALISTTEVFSGVPYIRIANGTTVNNLVFKPMVEKGSQITSYSPYFTPIELNKIGNYKDYINGTPDNWSIKRNVQNTIITEDNKDIINSFGEQENHKKVLINKSNLGWKTSWDTNVALINKYKEITTTSAVNSGCFATNFGQAVLTIWNDDFTDLTQAQNMLIGTEILIAKATETTEAITNQEIINQLNEIYNLQSYNGTTNITITSEDLELIMTASAIKGEA